MGEGRLLLVTKHKLQGGLLACRGTLSNLIQLSSILESNQGHKFARCCIMLYRSSSGDEEMLKIIHVEVMIGDAGFT